MFLSSAIITVHLENLRHNLKTLLARHPSLMPVIKADAYGHGVVAVARVLAEEGIQHMAVGSVGEGALLRQEGHTAFLLALMGLARDEDTALAASYDITPLVHSRESLERILAQSHLAGRAKPLTVAIKFDTGMSRLGFRVDEAAELARHDQRVGQVAPYLILQMRVKGLTKHHIQLVAVPPALEIGLARSERPLPKHPFIQAFIMNPDIPGTVSPNPDIRLSKHRSQNGFCIHD